MKRTTGALGVIGLWGVCWMLAGGAEAGAAAPGQATASPAASQPEAAPTVPTGPAFRKLQLSDQFFCEGGCFADFNKDGKTDVAVGPFWFQGPDFATRHEVCPPKAFDPKSYSDKFLIFAGDFNEDGWPDILHVGFPGKDTTWYENPAGRGGAWKARPAQAGVGGESPCWGDVNGDGRPDLICCHDGCFGYSVYDPAKPEAPWTFVPITRKGGFGGFTHGQGFGDINGDGRVDLLDAGGWYEQPADFKPAEPSQRGPQTRPAGAGAAQPWVRHPVKFADAGAQLLVCDVDGDGLNDVVTAWHCHGYGLVWHRQVKDAKGQIGFVQNVILPPKPDLKSDALRISQLHALALADFDGDGVMDFVTGKRFWAHGPGGDAEPNAPAVLYWFQARRGPDQTVQFIPHCIDDNSGVGTQVAAADLNGDGVPDVIVGNKKGMFLFLSQGK